MITKTSSYDGHTYTTMMDAMDFREALGFGTGPYPADANQATMINGRMVYLEPKTRKSMEMRVWTTCPDCGKRIAPGKLAQHMRMLKRKEAGLPTGRGGY
jgi:hypothetical protein